MNIKIVVKEASAIREKLLKTPAYRKDLDLNIKTIPSPKIGTDEIKLIIIGQDPTIRNPDARINIKTVLNLDKRGVLYHYINNIVEEIGYEIEKNVYATNLFKCFFKYTPANNVNILTKHLPYWLPLLKQEVSLFPNAKIITLGEPVMNQLIYKGQKKVREYWAYIGRTKANIKAFKSIKVDCNFLNHKIFPFPHIHTGTGNEFYQKYMQDYIRFLKTER